MYPLVKSVMFRGGAGRSMTREESVDALMPLVRRHHDLLHAYDAAIRHLGDRSLADRLNDVMNRARTELAKLKETIFSLAGTPPNGTDLDPDVRLGGTDAEIIHALDDAERAYRNALNDTLGLAHHQLRTTAILENNVTGSEARLGVLHPIVTRMRRPDSRSTRATSVPVDDATETPVDLAHDEHHAGAMKQPAIDIPPR
ncbi:MAG: hypothetical protein ABJF88_15915 [Rhodothermales bacterium]